MSAAIRICLTPEEDRRLLELSENPGVHPKTRRWAQMVRLAGQGWTAPQIAAFFHRDRSGVARILKRFRQEGMRGLEYRKRTGAKPKVTPEVKVYLKELLTQDRIWTIPQLREAIWERFGLKLGHNTLHRHLRELGYVWKRTRYVCAGQPPQEEVERFLREAEEAKRGRWRG